MKRSQPIYDSVQVHTAVAANTQLSFFTSALNQQANQTTTSTNTPYSKTDYHTNNKLSQTERNQKLLVRGFDIWMDETDSLLVTQALIETKPLFQFYVGDDKVFQMPLSKMINLKNGGMSFGLADDSTAATKSRKMALLLPGDEYYRLDYAIEIPELKTYKAVITMTAASTFKKVSTDFAVTIADAAYTTAFNVFVALRTDEEK